MNVLADANAGFVSPAEVAEAREQLTAALLADESLPFEVRLLLELREVEAGYVNNKRIGRLIGEAGKRH
jgi:plasmid stability protein